MELKMVLLTACLLCLSIITVSGLRRRSVCPSPPQGTVGICLFDPNIHCVDDVECGLGEKCCPHDCNRICKRVVRDRRRGKCPAPSSNIGICQFVEGVNCLTDSECGGPSQKCCSEGCGKICKDV